MKRELDRRCAIWIALGLTSAWLVGCGGGGGDGSADDPAAVQGERESEEATAVYRPFRLASDADACPLQVAPPTAGQTTYRVVPLGVSSSEVASAQELPVPRIAHRHASAGGASVAGTDLWHNGTRAVRGYVVAAGPRPYVGGSVRARFASPLANRFSDYTHLHAVTAGGIGVGQSSTLANAVGIQFAPNGAVAAMPDPDPQELWQTAVDAHAINEAGTVVGTSGANAFRLSRGVAVRLPSIWVRPGPAVPRAINESDQIAGGAFQNDVFKYQAVTWDARGNRRLPLLAFSSFDPSSYAYGINGNGDVVGVSNTADADGLPTTAHAALWLASGGVGDLGTLHGFARSRDSRSVAYDINDAGTIVGNATCPTAVSSLNVADCGFVRQPGQAMVELNLKLDAVSSARHWRINAATSVSNQGWIAARANDSSAFQDVLLVPNVDNDADGIPDDWELNGIPSAAGARDQVMRSARALPGVTVGKPDGRMRDIVVWYDWATPQGTTSYEPTAEQLALVAKAFGRQKIRVQFIRGKAIALSNRVFRGADGGGLDDLQAAMKAGDFLKRPGLGRNIGALVHYAVFVDSIKDAALPDFKPAGMTPKSANVDFGKDIVIAMGTLLRNGVSGIPSTDVSKLRDLSVASTVMHELGHTLGLGHGGVAMKSGRLQHEDTNHKPNHLSVMNYMYSGEQGWLASKGGYLLDYSCHDTSTVRTLDGWSYQREDLGLTVGSSQVWRKYDVYWCGADGLARKPARVPVNGTASFLDWNLNGTNNGAAPIPMSFYSCGSKPTRLPSKLQTSNEWKALQLHSAGGIGDLSTWYAY